MSAPNPADVLPSLVWHASPDRRIKYVNSWSCVYLGKHAEALHEQSWDAFVHRDDVGSILQAWRTMCRGAFLQSVDVRLRRADGVYRWHTVHLQSVSNALRRIESTIGVGIDIHDCRQAWELYESSERRLQAAFDGARVGAWEWNIETGMTRMTSTLVELYGLPCGTDTATSELLWQRVPSGFHTTFKEALDRGLEGRAPFEIDYPISADGGECRWLRMRGEPEFNAHGALVRAHGVTFDITEQRRAEERRRHSERRYRALVESTTALVWSANPRGEVSVAGDLWSRFTGKPVERLTGHGWLDSVHPDDRPSVERVWSKTMNQDLPGSYVFRIRRHDGVYRVMKAQAVPLRDDHGGLLEWFGTTTDITERHEQEAAKDAHNLRLSVAMQAAHITIVSINLGDWSLLFDRGARSKRGAREAGQGLKYQSVLRRVHADDRERFDAFLVRLAEGHDPDCPFEFRFRTHSGERWLHGSALLQRTEDGRPLRIIGSVADITDFKRMELTLRQTDRRKDEFLAMLAHELRNPLAPLRTAVALIERSGSADSRTCELVVLMQRQVEHMTRIVEDLLEVSRISQGRIILRKEPILVGSAVYSAVESIMTMVESHAQKLQVSVPDATVWVCCDPTRLAQILVNLLNNASKYTPDGGRISVEVESDEARVWVCIADTGTGISADLLPNVFELFSQGDRTLDRANGGLGIGLALVKKLVEAHSGTISVESPGPGLGTTVTVRLPRFNQHERHVHARSPLLKKRDSAHAALQILVVDDNRDAADSLAMLCETDGHTTCVAYGSEAAISACERFVPDVAMLDIGLPDIDGYELAKRLRHRGELSPLLIAITGYGQAEDRMRAQLAGFDYHFVKPVDVGKLMGLLADHAKRLST